MRKQCALRMFKLIIPVCAYVVMMTACHKKPEIPEDKGSKEKIVQNDVAEEITESSIEDETVALDSTGATDFVSGTSGEKESDTLGSVGTESAEAEFAEKESAETESAGTGSTETGSTEIKEFTEPAIEVIDTLDGLSAGDVLTEEQLDPQDIDKYFTVSEITEDSDVFAFINGKSYRVQTSIPLGNLRYLKLIHWNYEGMPQVGEIIVNKSIAGDVIDIFKNLYLQKYEIYSMKLVDNFWTGDPNDTDTASMNANNTSSFNDRKVDYSGSTSRHSYGMAIDINPRENPYILYDGSGHAYTTQDEQAVTYMDRSNLRPHMMTNDDLCVRLFKSKGFRWGGDWSSLKDYQHFDRK